MQKLKEKQNSQALNENQKKEEPNSADSSNKEVQEIPKVQAVQPDEEEEFLDEDEEAEEVAEEIPKVEEKSVVEPSKEVFEPLEDTISKSSETIENSTEEQLSREQSMVQEIALLQNDGVYRIELLHQLQEINKSLNVIAKSLMGGSEDEKRTI